MSGRRCPLCNPQQGLDKKDDQRGTGLRFSRDPRRLFWAKGRNRERRVVTKASNLRIRVTGVPPAEAEKLAAELSQMLRRKVPGIDLCRERESSDAMDMGSTVAIVSAVMSSGVMTAIGLGLKAFLGRMGSATLEIKGVVKATNIRSSDTVKLAQIFANVPPKAKSKS